MYKSRNFDPQNIEIKEKNRGKIYGCFGNNAKSVDIIFSISNN